jgi:hypothetical protein
VRQLHGVVGRFGGTSSGAMGLRPWPENFHASMCNPGPTAKPLQPSACNIPVPITGGMHWPCIIMGYLPAGNCVCVVHCLWQQQECGRMRGCGGNDPARS